MKQRMVLLASFVISLASGAAYAQGTEADAAKTESSDTDPAIGTTPGGRTFDGAPGANGEAAMAAPAAVAASAELGGYSTEIIMRPRVIPKGWFEVLGSLDAYQTVDSAAKSTLGLRLGGMVRYGAAPNLDVGVAYELALKPFDAGSDFGAEVRYALIPDPSLSFTAAATLEVNQYRSVLGIDAHYKFSRSVELFTSRQLVLDYGGDQVTSAVFLPVAVGVALTPHVYLFGDTTLASLGINPSESSFIFRDYISLTAGAYYSPTNKLDLGLVVDSPDVGTFDDNFAVSAVAQVRM